MDDGAKDGSAFSPKNAWSELEASETTIVWMRLGNRDQQSTSTEFISANMAAATL
jgi:hypothetical protein